MEKVVDAMGLACPLPVVNAKNAAGEMKEGGTLTVKVDNETAVNNLTKFATQNGMKVSSEKKADAAYEVTMEVPVGGLAASTGAGGAVVVIGSNVMGSGDDTLGTNLMKAFIFAVTQQDVLPETVLMYNGGVKLACEGSNSIDDLKMLEGEGVNILCCGTCLDFYGLKEKQLVGGVTNMYDIVEKMGQATTVIKP